MSTYEIVMTAYKPSGQASTPRKMKSDLDQKKLQQAIEIWRKAGYVRITLDINAVPVGS